VETTTRNPSLSRLEVRICGSGGGGGGGGHGHVKELMGYVRLKVFTAVNMKNGVSWDFTLCDSCKNRRFGELSSFIIRVTRIGELGTLAVTRNLCTFLPSLRRLLVTANLPSSPILVTLMTEALSSYEMSILTRVTRRNIPADAIIQLMG
jgi:hypothetical protein